MEIVALESTHSPGVDTDVSPDSLTCVGLTLGHKDLPRIWPDAFIDSVTPFHIAFVSTRFVTVNNR